MKPKRKAVTLVELLIVVLIIGVMAFIAVPRMGLSIISGGKAQTASQQIAAAIRYTRSLAITNAATNSRGFSFNMTTDPTGYKIEDLTPPTHIVETGSIAKGVTCSAGSFEFGPLGNKLRGDSSMTVEAGGKKFKITVISTTGMVKCEKQ
jgi:prepilin-type N-terminal cleavage/methylation domain-containing protein